MPVKKRRRRRPKVCGIYKITCKPSGKVYIGSSKDVFSRLNSHVTSLLIKTHTNKGLQTDFNKHTYQNFCFEVIELVGLETQLKAIEQGYLNQYSKAQKYNLRAAKAT